jgi:hypothetical protein
MRVIINYKIFNENLIFLPENIVERETLTTFMFSGNFSTPPKFTIGVFQYENFLI